ncbi:MFS transporter [Nocardia nova]|uniref:MFS transporter n=1 Tax=Nocardia nova TaxID=37330 RepID=A0A2S6ALT4_9NOCA|nr:MFS transporter [Nocardia nova]PPJ26983.1 MFS transporter [Nocardia nova]PPJ36153.1 MFS transporter [Nocardia nova]
MRENTLGGPESVVLLPGSSPSEGTAWLAFAGCLIAVFMQMIDVTIVNTALPRLTSDLGASRSAELLVISGYSLAFACTLLSAARLGAVLGRRMLFLASVVAFTAASVWCGLSTGADELVLARIVQGVAGAGMAAQTIAILIASFPRERHSLVFAMYGGVAGFAGMLGPILGGALLTVDIGGWGWRTVFLINLPIGMVAFALAWRFLRIGRPASPERLDLGGAALSGAGLLLLVSALALVQQHGWQPQPFALVLAGVVVCALFVAHQIRRSSRGAGPLMRLELFSDRGFRIGSILICVFFGLFTAFVFAASITMQDVLGYTPWHTAIVMTLFAVGAGAGAIASLFLVRQCGVLILAGGVTLYGGCMAGGAIYLHLTSGIANPLIATPAVCAAGFGVGIFAVQIQPIMLSGLNADHMSETSGVVPTIEQIGNALGLAVLTTLFFRSHTLNGAITMMLALAVVSFGLGALTLALPRAQNMN